MLYVSHMISANQNVVRNRISTRELMVKGTEVVEREAIKNQLTSKTRVEGYWMMRRRLLRVIRKSPRCLLHLDSVEKVETVPEVQELEEEDEALEVEEVVETHS